MARVLKTKNNLREYTYVPQGSGIVYITISQALHRGRNGCQRYGVQLSMVPAAWACVSLQASSSLPLETLKWLEFLKFAYGGCQKSFKT